MFQKLIPKTSTSVWYRPTKSPKPWWRIVTVVLHNIFFGTPISNIDQWVRVRRPIPRTDFNLNTNRYVFNPPFVLQHFFCRPPHTLGQPRNVRTNRAGLRFRTALQRSKPRRKRHPSGMCSKYFFIFLFIYLCSLCHHNFTTRLLLHNM